MTRREKCQWIGCAKEATEDITYASRFTGEGLSKLCDIHAFQQKIKGIVIDSEEL